MQASHVAPQPPQFMKHTDSHFVLRYQQVFNFLLRRRQEKPEGLKLPDSFLCRVGPISACMLANVIPDSLIWPKMNRYF